jgi:hypothetical protein
MSTKVPAKRGGERPAWSREPFQSGNRAAGKSGFYVTALAASEREEVQTIADALRDLSPLDGEAQEALVQLVASQIWRQRQAVAYIDAAGIEKVARASSLLRDLATLERAVLAGLKALGLTAQSCADLGLTWARTAALDVDLEKLSPKQLAQLEKLLDIVQSESNGAAAEISEK